MKLATTLALVTLALCCSPGLALVPEAIVTQALPPLEPAPELNVSQELPFPEPAPELDVSQELPSPQPTLDPSQICSGTIVRTLFLSKVSEYETFIEFFSPDTDVRDAATKMKALVDTLCLEDKDRLIKFMDKIVESPLCAV